MNTNGIIGLIAAIIVVGGGIWYFSSHAPQGGQPAQGGSQAQSGTLASLASLQGSVKCDVATAAGDTQSSGTVYVSDGQMRGDFNSTTKATGELVIESHLIRTGGFMYTWSSLAAQGIKLSDESLTATTTASESKGPVDATTQVQYTCAPWVADATLFTPPASITFLDVSAMMHGGVPSGAMPVKGTTYPQGPTNKPYTY